MKKLFLLVSIFALFVMVAQVAAQASEPRRELHHESQGVGDPSWTKCMPAAAWNGHHRHVGDWQGDVCGDPSPTATNEPTNTPPTATNVPPTDTPPTSTSVPPTVQPTKTTVPTMTSVPPTATATTPPTTPTVTSTPPTATSTATSTPVSTSTSIPSTATATKRPPKIVTVTPVPVDPPMPEFMPVTGGDTQPNPYFLLAGGSLIALGLLVGATNWLTRRIK